MDEQAAVLTNSADSAVAHVEKETDWLGVVLGVLTFLLGIGLLVFTFVHAARLYFGPQAIELNNGAETNITDIGISMSGALLRIGVLAVMSVVGSVISSKGVKLYSASRSRSHRGD